MRAFGLVQSPGFMVRSRPGPSDSTSTSLAEAPLISDTSVPRSNTSPETLPSTILDPTSNIVALKFNDTVNVYGVAAKSKVIALVSPFVEPITPEAKAANGMIAGCTARKAWIVFQNQTSSKENIIYLSDVSDPRAKNSALAAPDVRDKTALSMFHDTKRLWVVYQHTKGKIVAYNNKDQSDVDVSHDNSLFIKGTAIASVFIPVSMIDASKNPQFKASTLLGRVIIYWVRSYNGTSQLYRSHADVDSKSTGLVFSTPIPATSDAVEVHETAQIGFVLDEKDQLNRLYVSKLGEDNISQVSDSWFPEEEGGKDGKDQK
ncbi:hypothetical protein INS49_007889 [Diaporthe citri]|uniref:uncharacterized protein n=1 Tax=Diaporthe citri TaxID=83186 RepID=UPI001C80AB3C|nr:uncharacterized protein INS49_007889 [Diaporthe citri]KAG6362795.1 hypothetical protein INS49_007889 [Diaporthe citri]